MSYHAILFDLDGTLLDTLDDLADATNRALRTLGFPEHPVAAYKYFIGDGVENLVRRVLPADRCEPALMLRCATQMRLHRPALGGEDAPLSRRSRTARRALCARRSDGRALQQAGRIHRALRRPTVVPLAF